MGVFTTESVRRFAPAAWLPLSHAEAIEAQPELTLIGLCDISPKLLGLARERFNVPGFVNHIELLEALHPDVLTVATRTPERAGIIGDAVTAGVRGLHVEKPLCNSVSQLIELERLLALPTIVCTFGTLRRYMPIYRRALELATTGRFGTLQQIQIGMGRAALMWTHPHSLDLLLFLTGDREVARVSARFAPESVEREGAVLDGDPIVLSALVEFTDGVTGLVGQAGGCDATLCCSNGLIEIQSDGRRLNLRHGDGEDTYWDVVTTEYADSRSGGTRLALDRLVRGMKGNSASQVRADKSAILQSQRLLLACAQSHLAGGAAVDPGCLDPALVITGRSGNRYA